MPPLSSSLALPPHGPAVDRDALQGGQGLPHPREGDAAASQSGGDRLDGEGPKQRAVPCRGRARSRAAPMRPLLAG